MSTAKIFAPSFARAMQKVFPNPLAAPVTMMTLSVSLITRSPSSFTLADCTAAVTEVAVLFCPPCWKASFHLVQYRSNNYNGWRVIRKPTNRTPDIGHLF